MQLAITQEIGGLTFVERIGKGKSHPMCGEVTFVLSLTTVMVYAAVLRIDNLIPRHILL